MRYANLHRMVVALCMLALAGPALAIDVVWDGGDGDWNSPNWNGGQLIDAIIGVADGADGFLGPNEEVQNIIIGGGATVSYDANAQEADFEMRQGSNLIIRDGATWLQQQDDSWSENRWTEMDLSNLILDGGTFRRVGAVGAEGGGALIFGSWQGDDTFEEPESLDHLETYIRITNGGRLENEGQLWFGSWTDTPAGGTIIKMFINDGTVDLTGGHITPDDELPGNGDLVFTNLFTTEEDQPTYAIVFTGPGSITVDRTGIVNVYPDEFGVVDNFFPVGYRDLWEVGVLQAHGKSGVDGLNFDTFFTETGTLGADDYTLTSLVLTADYDIDGDVDTADLNVQITNWTGALEPGEGSATFELGDLDGDGDVDTGDLNATILSWTGARAAAGGGTAAGAAPAAVVPEPHSSLLLLAGLGGLILRRRRRSSSL